MEALPLTGIPEAIENFEQLVTEYNSLADPPRELPSVSDLQQLMNNTSYVAPRGSLSGGKKMKSGGSKSRKSKKSSRSRRADLRERYKLSPKKRGKRKVKKNKK